MHGTGSAVTLLDGRHDHEGLGVAAGSRVGINLNGDLKGVTLDPRVLKAGSGSFVVRGDGRILQQGVATDQAQPLSLDVRGIQKLELIAPPATIDVTAFAWHTVNFQR